MKAIMFAAGSDGEIHPHLGIGRELLARGHRVVFVTTEDYLDLARESGFEALSFLGADEKQAFVRRVEKLGAVARVRGYARFLADKVAAVCALVESRLDQHTILVAPPFFYVLARLLHAKYGVPYLSTLVSPAHLYSLRQPPSFKSLRWYHGLPYGMRKALFHGSERVLFDPFFRTLLRETAQRLGLVLPRQVIGRWWYSPQRILGLFEPWFCPPPEDWPDQVRLTGFPMYLPAAGTRPPSPGLVRFVEAGAPPILFNPGTETARTEAFFVAALEAARRLQARAVFVTRYAEQLPALPDTVWHESYVPLPWLLPRVGALVHRGGIGTIALALRAGTPQLILPGWTDQLDNGLRLARLGGGLVWEGVQEPGPLAQNIRRLIDEPGIRAACAQAQARIQPGCACAAEAIEQTFFEARGRYAAALEGSV